MPASDPISPYPIRPCPEPAVRRLPAPAAGTATVSLDAVARQRAKSLPAPVRYELKGVEFTLPSPKAVPLDVWERLRGGPDPLTALGAVVGEEKAREMAVAGFTLCDLDVIVEDWERRHGVRS